MIILTRDPSEISSLISVPKDLRIGTEEQAIQDDYLPDGDSYGSLSLARTGYVGPRLISLAKSWFEPSARTSSSIGSMLRRTLTAVNDCLFWWELESFLLPVVVYTQRYIGPRKLPATSMWTVFAVRYVNFLNFPNCRWFVRNSVWWLQSSTGTTQWHPRRLFQRFLGWNLLSSLQTNEIFFRQSNSIFVWTRKRSCCGLNSSLLRGARAWTHTTTAVALPPSTQNTKHKKISQKQ